MRERAVQQYKISARMHFMMGNCLEAIRMYTAINQEAGPDDVSSLSYRAIAYMGLGLFKLALKDVGKILEIDPQKQEAIYRKIKCLTGLGKHQEALEVFRSEYTANEDDPYDQHLLKSLENYIAHSRGEYNILEIMDMSERNLMDFPEPKYFEFIQDRCLDIMGEFNNGPIKVVLIPGKGRGVIATDDIAPGQLIAVTKALARVSGEWTPPEEKDGLVEEVHKKLLLADKKTRTKFRKMSTLTFPEELEERPQWLLPINWTASLECQDTASLCWEIQTRINSNMFINKDRSPRVVGIWLSAVSYLNNDCIDGNVSRMYFEDKIMLRAFKEIKKGEELTIPYINPEEINDRKLLFKRHNFECKCRLCEFEELESSGIKSEINECLEFIESQLPTLKEQNVSNEVMEKFRRICELRSSNPDLNMAMKTEIILSLGEKLFESGFIEQSIEVFQAIRKAMCNPSGIKKGGLLEMDKMLIKSLLALGNVNEVISALKTYKEDLLLVYGTVDVVERFGRDILKALEESEMQLNFYEI